MGSTPGYVTASPDGRGIYVAEPDAGTVAVVDTATNKVTSTIPIPTGPPRYLAFSTDGSKIYVSVWNDVGTIPVVSVFDTTANGITATISVGGRLFASAVTPDGRFPYVPDPVG